MIPIDVSNFARRFPKLTAALNTAELEALFETLDVLEVGADEALIAEGTMTDALYLVWDGELDVSFETPYGEREIARVGPGAFLGEVSLMDPGPATATVTTQQGCTALSLNHGQLEGLWEAHPHLATVFLQQLARVVAGRIRAANRYLDEILAEEKPILRPNAVVGAHSLLYQVEEGS
jgi:CRP-like cAMP-binding protein